MAILYSPESEYVKEMAKWEMRPSQFTPDPLKPGRPYGKFVTEYPRMMFKAQQMPNGKWALSMNHPPRIGFASDNDWAQACEYAEKFSERCHKIVANADEERQARNDGWRSEPKEALDFRQELEDMVARAAAERAYSDSRMSEKAREEAKKFDDAAFGHQAEIPEKPKARRGRPRKVVAESATS